MTGVLSPADAGRQVSMAADVDLVARAVVTSALVGSAVIHGTVAGEHFGEWVLAGFFFIVVQLAELTLALAAVYAWSRRAALLVVGTGLTTVALWSVSRTTGLPMGPDDFRAPEPVGVPDLACGVLELMSVAAACVALYAASPRGRAGSRSRPRPSRRGIAVACAAVWAALALTAWGGAPTVLGGGEDAHHGSGAVSNPR
ncbi:hypothetical protein ACFFOS_09875 [Nocardioides kongjuensis]|uniref:DoxX family membrane protein n=1 Tax=Nocardioides kongjuensis TaxID=349522 RepID=A0A852RP43_9ACTN|nr:hypothetical protein [Nocardioides kongjuensis]NYD30630.1 hypothetical protein [Nocardioides kongjuensis]